MPDLVVIWSGQHRAYWRPDSRGYTEDVAEAGRYEREVAVRATAHCGPDKRIEIRPAPTDLAIDCAAACPPGCAIIERIGWDEDGRFTATLHFPTGAPDIQALVVWRKTPVRLVVAESDNA